VKNLFVFYLLVLSEDVAYQHHGGENDKQDVDGGDADNRMLALNETYELVDHLEGLITMCMLIGNT